MVEKKIYPQHREVFKHWDGGEVRYIEWFERFLVETDEEDFEDRTEIQVRLDNNKEIFASIKRGHVSTLKIARFGFGEFYEILEKLIDKKNKKIKNKEKR